MEWYKIKLNEPYCATKVWWILTVDMTCQLAIHIKKNRLIERYKKITVTSKDQKQCIGKSMWTIENMFSLSVAEI